MVCEGEVESSGDGAITQLSISPNEKMFVVATLKGVVCVLEQNEGRGARRVLVSNEHQGSEVTALQWNSSSSEIFIADDAGRVSVLTVSVFTTKTIFQTPSFQLMQLDSRVVQLDWYSDLLLVSTLSRSYLCDTVREQYRQLGQKLREGEYGSCFFSTVDQPLPSLASGQRSGSFRSIDDTQESRNSYEGLKNVKMFCARPGSRVWEVNLNGTVVSTHQFKEALAIPPTHLDSKLNDTESIRKISSLLQELKKHAIERPKQLATKLKSGIFLVGNSHAYEEEENSLQSKYKGFSKEGVKLKQSKEKTRSSSVSPKLPRRRKPPLDTSSLVKSETSGSTTSLPDSLDKSSKSLVVTEANPLSEGKSTLTGDIPFQPMTSPEAIQALKEIGHSVSGKLVTGTRALKEKWQMFEGKMKLLHREPTVELLDVKPQDYIEDRTSLTEEDELNGKKSDIVYDKKKDVPKRFPLDVTCVVELFQVVKSSSVNDFKTIALELLHNLWIAINNYYKFSTPLDTSGTQKNEISFSFLVEEPFPFHYYFSEDSIKAVVSSLKSSKLGVFMVKAYEELNQEPECSCCCGYPGPQPPEPKFTEIGALIFEHLVAQEGSEAQIFLHKVPADCWTKMANEKQVSMASEQTHAAAEEIVTLTSSSVSTLCAKLTRRDDVWCVDSGATTHMCRDKNSFLELTPTISQKRFQMGKNIKWAGLQHFDVIAEEVGIAVSWWCQLGSMTSGMGEGMWRHFLRLKSSEPIDSVLPLIVHLGEVSALEERLSEMSLYWGQAFDYIVKYNSGLCLNCGQTVPWASGSIGITWSSIGALAVKGLGPQETLKLLMKYSDKIKPGELDARFYQSCIFSAIIDNHATGLRDKVVNMVHGKLENSSSSTALISTKVAPTLQEALLVDLEKAPQLVSHHQDHHWGARVEFKTGVCPCCTLPLDTTVLLHDGGLTVFRCGHAYHTVCIRHRQPSLLCLVCEKLGIKQRELAAA
uniref:RING-type domain-containing protein n=1 Tax=Timema shepardi TaxID=629360 RepID=A0A7R9FWY2_TIMSH|nr:unnamed protein product [Timema shepardi]